MDIYTVKTGKPRMHVFFTYDRKLAHKYARTHNGDFRSVRDDGEATVQRFSPSSPFYGEWAAIIRDQERNAEMDRARRPY